jgi:hypothetical protein
MFVGPAENEEPLPVVMASCDTSCRLTTAGTRLAMNEQTAPHKTMAIMKIKLRAIIRTNYPFQRSLVWQEYLEKRKSAGFQRFVKKDLF